MSDLLEGLRKQVMQNRAAELGYTSSEQMIREGYELDPAQIELAVAWLN